MDERIKKFSSIPEGVTKQDLPKLPVPPLQQTLERFLRSTRPLLTSKEYDTTKALVKKFAEPGGDGEKLQRLLEARAQHLDNWLSAWWIDWAYLSIRVPQPVFATLGCVQPLYHPPREDSQVRTTACLMAAALDFWDNVYNHKMKVESMGPHELDMSQFYNIMGVCRVPDQPLDNICLYDFKNPPNFFVVIHKNRFFQVPAFGSKGEKLNQVQLRQQLQAVMKQFNDPCLHPVGMLTTEDRDTWARLHKILEQDSENRQTLDAIHRSLLVFCLDDKPPRSASSEIVGRALNTLHGGGGSWNSTNRWFDKNVELIIGPNGEWGAVFEHSPLDGYPMSMLVNQMDEYNKKYGDGKVPDPIPAAGSFQPPKLLRFNLNQKLKTAISAASGHLERILPLIDIHYVNYTKYGKEFIKQHKFSPDSYIQLAIQLAFYRLHGHPTAQYESAATRMYLGGRTETIRTCSSEAVDFVRAVVNPNTSNSTRVAALRKAIKSHRDYAMQAVMGQGVDRHLLGLRLIAQEQGIEVPEIFKDPGFTRTTHMRLSTSQVPMRCHAFLFYGPLVEDGYGCCYNPLSDRILCGTSSMNSCTETNAAKFSEALENALTEMGKIVSSTPEQDKL